VHHISVKMFTVDFELLKPFNWRF